MSSEEEELAALREERASKLGIPLPQRNKRNEPESEDSSESEAEDADDEDQPVLVDAAELFADDSRAQLPMEFGKTTGKLQKELSDFADLTRLNSQEVNSTEHYFKSKLKHDPYNLPITHEAILPGHHKLVTCFDIDHSGSRIITGSLDYHVCMYDFNGMKSDLQCFRTLEPHEGYPVLSLSFSPSGDRFLVVTGSATPLIYDRDGLLQGDFPRGDMYIRDMRNTRGHICGCCQGQWHPETKTNAITCSEDGTIRIWDTNEFTQRTVIKPNIRKSGRVAVTSCAYNSDGSLIVGGLRDGSIQIWGSKGERVGRSAAVEQVPAPKLQMIPRQEWTYLANAGLMNREAHLPDSDITCLRFAKTKPLLASRCMDGTLKLWDIRNFKTPVTVFDDLPNVNEQTQCCFSPNDKFLLTGLSTEEGNDYSGSAIFIDVDEKRIIRRLDMKKAVCAVTWHSRLNQVFFGAGTRTSGGTHVMYHPDRSERGALLCMTKTPSKHAPDDFEPPVVVHAPNALPMYQQPRNRKRFLQKEYEEKLKKIRPEGGAAAKELGVGKGGKLGATGGTLLTQYLLKTRGTMKSVDEEADPREELLRHKNAKEEFGIYTAAYQRTQPKPLYAQVEEEEKQDEEDEEDEEED